MDLTEGIQKRVAFQKSKSVESLSNDLNVECLSGRRRTMHRRLKTAWSLSILNPAVVMLPCI